MISTSVILIDSFSKNSGSKNRVISLKYEQIVQKNISQKLLNLKDS